MENKKDYKPKLLVLSVEEMIKNIRVKANSNDDNDYDGPSCMYLHADETACHIWADGEEAGGGGDDGSVSMCVQVGPLAGCDIIESWACTFAPVTR